MKNPCRSERNDFGPDPFTLNVERAAMQNQNFRTAVWTGCNLQMTLMSIPPCGEIGCEIHPDTDQFIRIEQGYALVKMGECKCDLNFRQNLCGGDVVFVPAGTWHNIINIGQRCLKVSSVYAPPNHPWGTVHHTKADAEKGEYAQE
ncbi:MAG: cupin domain-containing protein [Clostridia bacterium]|nr:cupin domain-containing protein [Clostridia bacterium]MDY5556067.1 cupin domain-containing protein [Blautia sp.]